MRLSAAFATISLLASLYAAHAEPNPGPTDKSITGVFSPDRVKADQEAFAKKALDSGTAPCNEAGMTISCGAR